ncbi:hypothetical protein ACE01N_19550 [Saccharicrinis sp. FJH2]|uniref:hypothetical protein n=1 Tax=Saccharicrinis sp. FJH65 TaxID=3344659 RepID=UPI0035F47793
MRFRYRLRLLLIISLGLFLTTCKPELKFDSKTWKENGGENATLDTRYRMTKDLIENKILINKTELEIIELIGNSEKVGNENNPQKKFYPVQEKYGWDIDPEEMIFLEVHFNEKGLSDTIILFKTK